MDSADEANQGKSARESMSREEFMSALFASMVIHQTNMALVFLGRAPHPESGEQIQDLETARMFIDQLEMLEVKTKGNLDKREEQLLKQSLTTLRMAFVDAASHPGPKVATQAQPGTPEAASAGAQPAEATTEEGEGRKKFSKKY
jgi:hypothetical protein